MLVDNKKNLIAHKLFENGETFITKLHKVTNQVLKCRNNCHWKIGEQDNKYVYGLKRYYYHWNV